MSDVVIRAADLRKVYRLYPGPMDRFLDMIRIRGRGNGRYAEHVALDGINLTIRRGEKVAIIGRNGAGKSTLLKLVSKIAVPTSGTIEVAGHARALLQIGAGFYPDFTGRENVLAYLAHLGVTGKQAEQQVRTIVEFAELEEYVDQPIKTYSTGMAARLMFATSTSISPDVLVLDEVLSVGDAYFAQKSFESIRSLSEHHGTTVLLVTHDIYAASKLCERMIWLDRGRIMFDGRGAEAIRAYEDSVRVQEEQRLRRIKQSRLANVTGRGHWIVEIRQQNNMPQDVPVYFSGMALLYRGELVSELPIGGDLDVELTCWGTPEVWHGRMARPMLSYGSPFHKVGGPLAGHGPIKTGNDSEFEIAIDYWSEAEIDLEVRAFTPEGRLYRGSLPSRPKQWQKYRFMMGPVALTEDQSEVSITGVHGSAAIAVTEVQMLNAASMEGYVFSHGQPVDVRVAFQVRDPDLDEKAQVLIAIHREGIQDVCRFITRDLNFTAGMAAGAIHLRIPALPLADGTYTLTVMIAAAGYYDRQQTLFYSINPGVYACLPRILEFRVVNGGPVADGTIVVGQGQWSLVEKNDDVARRALK